MKQNFFEYTFNESTNYYEIASREFRQIKTQLLNALTNHGRPFVYVQDGNYRNRGELYLLHQYEGIELKQDYAQDTLANLQKLWSARCTSKRSSTTSPRSCRSTAPVTKFVKNKRNWGGQPAQSVEELDKEMLN